MFRASCDEPKCGRVLVALPVLRWMLGHQISRQDCVPERLEKYGFPFGIEGYEVLFPRVRSTEALAALKRGHTDRWTIKCLLCIASIYVDRVKRPHTPLMLNSS